MNVPLITLQPGGSRPPTPLQKINILAVLGAASSASVAEKAPLTAPAFNGNAAFQGLTEGVANLGNSNGTRTLSIATATSLETTLTGNCTFTMPTLAAGKSFIFDVLTGAGGFTPTFTGVTWPGGVTPTFPITAATRITIGFRTNATGTVWLGGVAGGGTSAWSDITGKPAAVTALSGTNTGDQTPTSLGLVIGTDVQAYDADLTAIAALATTAHGRSLLTSADAVASRVAIGAGTNSLPAPLALTSVPVNGEDSKAMANFTIRFSTTANISWSNGGSSTFTNENYTYVGNNEWQVTPSERLYYSNGYWYLIQYSAVFDSTAVLQAAGGATADPSSLTFVHAAISQGSGGAFTLTPISGTYAGTPAVPPITELSQIALATVAGAVSEWSAISMTQWREISGRMPAPIFSAAVPVSGQLAVFAQTTIRISASPSDGKRLFINGRTYTYRTTGGPYVTDEISSATSAGDCLINTLYAINTPTSGGSVNADVFASPGASGFLILTARTAGVSGNSITVSDDSTVINSGPGLSGGVNAVAPTPVITVISQNVIVNHTDGTFTEWVAASMTQWLPRTAGILKHASGQWYRSSLAADGTAQYDLLPNQ